MTWLWPVMPSIETLLKERESGMNSASLSAAIEAKMRLAYFTEGRTASR